MHGYAIFNMIVPGPLTCCRYEDDPWELCSRDIGEKAKQNSARNKAKCSKCFQFLCNNSGRTWFFNALTFAPPSPPLPPPAPRIYTVCKARIYPGTAGQGLIRRLLLTLINYIYITSVGLHMFAHACPSVRWFANECNVDFDSWGWFKLWGLGCLLPSTVHMYCTRAVGDDDI